MKRTLLLTMLFLVILKSWSQKYDEIRGAENLAQGYTSLNKENPYNLFNHTASTVYGDSNFVAFEYKNRFNLKETNTATICIGRNFKPFFIGVGIKRFGSDIFNENQFVIGMAKKIEHNFSIGINIGGAYTRINQQLQQNTILTNLSIRYKISALIECGSNVLLTKNSTSKNYQEIKIGAKLNLAPTFNWCVEFIQNSNIKPTFYTGINYQYEKFLSVRLGTYQKFSAFTAGFGVNFSQTNLNFYTECLMNTGWSNGISLNYVF